MEDERKIIVCSTPTKAFESFLYELRQVDTVLGNSFNLIAVDDLEPEVVTQPKNKPHGPQRNSKKGKARRW